MNNNENENAKPKYKDSHGAEILGTIVFTIVLMGLMWAASKWLL